MFEFYLSMSINFYVYLIHACFLLIYRGSSYIIKYDCHCQRKVTFYLIARSLLILDQNIYFRSQNY